MLLCGVTSPSPSNIFVLEKNGLRKAHAPPFVDEKLGEEEGSLKEKNDAMAMCRKYVGQMMWMTTRTRPDIAACLGILASFMVRLLFTRRSAN